MIDRDPAHLDPVFRERLGKVLADLGRWCIAHKRGYQPMVIEGLRSRKRQLSLIATGKSWTLFSRHCEGLAADVAPVGPDGQIDWDDEHFWAYYGHLVRLRGLVWGGDWRQRDMVHCEWPASDRNTRKCAVAWLKSKGLI